MATRAVVLYFDGFRTLRLSIVNVKHRRRACNAWLDVRFYFAALAVAVQ